MNTKPKKSILTVTASLLIASLNFAPSAHAAGTSPSAPLNVATSAVKAHEITVTWNMPTDLGGGDLTNYVVAVSRDGGKSWHSAINLNFDDLTMPSQSQAVNMLDDYYWLHANTTFRLKVAAVNDAGTGPFSQIVTVTTPTSVPMGYLGLGAAAKYGPKGGLLLTWVAPADNGGSKILGYKVYYRAAGTKTGAAGSSRWVLMANLDPKVFKFETPVLAKGKNWEIDVRAYNAKGLDGGSSLIIDIAKNGKLLMFR